MMREKIVSEDVELVIDDIFSFSDVLENKKILITGGKGFLGTYFVKILLGLNRKFTKASKIIILDNLITAKDKNNLEDDNVKFIQQDISEEFAFPGELDFIIHAASIASPPIYRKFPLKTIDVNYQGTRNLLDLARKKKIKGMLFLSSSEIYGDPTVIPTPESYWGHVSSIGPRACYDESKRLAETLSILYHQLYDVPIKIARPFNVYGPFLNLNDGRMIPDFMKNGFDKSEIVIHSDGTPTRSFCYITDAMRAFFRILLLGPNGSIFNVGNNEEISVKNAADAIKKVFNKPIAIKLEKSFDPHYVTDNPQRRCPDLSKIGEMVEYFPQIKFEIGIKRLYQWYVEQLT